MDYIGKCCKYIELFHKFMKMAISCDVFSTFLGTSHAECKVLSPKTAQQQMGSDWQLMAPPQPFAKFYEK